MKCFISRREKEGSSKFKLSVFVLYLELLYFWLFHLHRFRFWSIDYQITRFLLKKHTRTHVDGNHESRERDVGMRYRSWIIADAQQRRQQWSWKSSMAAVVQEGCCGKVARQRASTLKPRSIPTANRHLSLRRPFVSVDTTNSPRSRPLRPGNSPIFI